MNKDLAEEVARKYLMEMVKDLARMLSTCSTGQICLEINTNCGGITRTYLGFRSEIKK